MSAMTSSTITNKDPLHKSWAIWAGRVFAALPSLVMVASGSAKLLHAAPVVEGFTGKFGYPAGALTAIGLLELTCVLLYLVPRTAILGAVVLTGYLGGAVATHVRIGEPFVVPILIGILVWAGLWLRDERVRALVPLRAR